MGIGVGGKRRNGFELRIVANREDLSGLRIDDEANIEIVGIDRCDFIARSPSHGLADRIEAAGTDAGEDFVWASERGWASGATLGRSSAPAIGAKMSTAVASRRPRPLS